MNRNELAKILNDHALWLRDRSGARAHLSGADLRGANLFGANLRGAVVIQSGPLGSRRDYLVTVWQLGWLAEETRAGCWVGTLDELELRVAQVHGDTRYGLEYRAAITYHRARLAIAHQQRTDRDGAGDPGGPRANAVNQQRDGPIE